MAQNRANSLCSSPSKDPPPGHRGKPHHRRPDHPRVVSPHPDKSPQPQCAAGGFLQVIGKQGSSLLPGGPSPGPGRRRAFFDLAHHQGVRARARTIPHCSGPGDHREAPWRAGPAAPPPGGPPRPERPCSWPCWTEPPAGTGGGLAAHVKGVEELAEGEGWQRPWCWPRQRSR